MESSPGKKTEQQNQPKYTNKSADGVCKTYIGGMDLKVPGLYWKYII